MTRTQLNYLLHDASLNSGDLVRGSFMNFEEVRNFWADVLGIRGPQWMIIVALQKLDHGEGVPVMAVATMLRVNPIFVMTQSRLLEKKGFVRRTEASHDSGIVSLSLTDKANQHLAKLV